MKMLVLVNPRAAGGRTMRVLDTAREIARELPHDFIFRVPESRNRTVIQARDAAKAGFDAVVALGGDGTLGDVIEGANDTGVKVGVIPAGRGNDAARNLGFPSSWRDALRGLAHPTEREIDVPTLNSSPFIGVAGVGFDAEVVASMHRYPCRIVGTLCYALHVVKTILTYRPVKLEIRVDGEVRKGRYTMAAVANGPAYGGGMRIAPGARMDDGVLDICLIEAISMPRLLWHFPKVYAGKHTGINVVEMLRGRDVRISSPYPIALAADGDPCGSTPAHLRIGHKRVHLLIPNVDR